MTRRFFLFSTGASLFGQGVETKAEIRGKKVIADAIDALGGGTFLAMTDRVESGRAYSYYRDQISGLSIAKIYTRYLTVAPAKTGQELAQLEKEVFGKTEDTSVLFLQNGGWNISWRGSKEMEPDDFNRYRESTLRNVLYILRARLHEPGMIFEFQNSDVVDNLPVDIVNITDADDHVVSVQFHQSTKLPVRQSYKRKNEITKDQDEEVTLFTRYLDAGGVQWPHQIHRERNGDKVYEIFSDSVKIDQDLADGLFTPDQPGSGKPRKTKKK